MDGETRERLAQVAKHNWKRQRKRSVKAKGWGKPARYRTGTTQIGPQSAIIYDELVESHAEDDEKERSANSEIMSGLEDDFDAAEAMSSSLRGDLRAAHGREEALHEVIRRFRWNSGTLSCGH